MGGTECCCYNCVDQWEEHAILRFGKMKKRTKKAGCYMYCCCGIDQIIVVDRRIQTFVLPRQRSLTKDNIPVDVDGVIYFKCIKTTDVILNIDDWRNATKLASTTAIRDMVGKSTLDDLLSNRDSINKLLKEHVHEFGSQWGVDVVAVELKDVIVSKELEDAIAREPAAEREKRGRVKLAEAEVLAAEAIVKAGELYANNPTALALRSMNMMYEMTLDGKGTMVFVPTENTGAGMPGAIGMNSIQQLSQGNMPSGFPMPTSIPKIK